MRNIFKRIFCFVTALFVTFALAQETLPAYKKVNNVVDESAPIGQLSKSDWIRELPIPKDKVQKVSWVKETVEVTDKKGRPVKDKKGREWMNGMIGLLKYIEGNRTWREAIVQITSAADGSLTLVPAEGDEVFLFGYPEHWKEKFKKIEKYYEYIAPRENGKKYKTVNVRYKGQIICR